ncbi:hypothetical protein HYS93_00805 [Candidatus Daviesbacteria bacterium]|nr:hypothetical protein [Candidatus Daviesbacteria bacterium]
MSSLAERARSLGRYIQSSLPFTRSEARTIKVIEPPTIVIETEDGSRTGRRKALKALKQQPVGVLHRSIIEIHNQLGRSKKRVNKLIGDNLSWGEIIYSADPALLGYLSVRRRLAETMDYLQMANLSIPLASPEYLNVLERENLFDYKVGGVSFLEIEKMPMQPELSLEDISRIDRLTMDGKKLFFGREVGYLRFALLYLAAFNYARPDSKVSLPENLRELRRRAVGYFDYYTDLMTQFNLSDEVDLHLIWDLMGGRSFLPHALATYIPARRGITPSSAVKLFETKFQSMEPIFGFSSRIWARRMTRAMIASTKQAYSQNCLPEDLEKFQHYDPEADSRASERVLQHFDQYSADPEVYENASAVLKRFQQQYRKKLRREILGSKNGRVRIDMGQAGIASSLTAARHYQDTLMFVLHFDPQTHLTIELDRAGKIYGIPANLFRNDPNIALAMTDRLLDPVMKWLDLRYPTTTQAAISAPWRIPQLVELVTKDEEIATTPKRKTLRLPRPSEIMHTTPKTSVAGESERRKCVVIHSRKKVKEMLPKNTPEEAVDRIMAAIKDYEFGRDASAKTLQLSGGLVQIRTGDFRVELEHQRGRIFRLVDAGDKKDIRRRVQPKVLT